MTEAGADDAANHHQQQQEQQQELVTVAAAAAAVSADSSSSSSSSSSSRKEITTSNQSPNPPQSSPSLQPSSSSSSQPPSSSSSSSAGLTDKGRRQQLMHQWQETAVKAAQLRSVIEWGAAAYGQGSTPSDGATPNLEPMQTGDVSVLIWPGGRIEEVPRGTTAGQILKERGVLAIINGGGSNDAKGQGREGSAGEGSERVSTLVNVNNQLVDESTVLSDGDLVILARERLKI
jgi:hypothetical protein